jgi:RNA polymerase sigma-70 factor (ECF subfamily)
MDADAALAARLADDLEAAFPDVVRSHADRLYTVALHLLGDARDAEEVAQDAFIRAHRALRTYDQARIRELRLRGWLTAIAVRLARNRRRRLSDRRPPVTLDGTIDRPVEPLADSRHDPHASAARGETRRILEVALARLPAPLRTAVVLRHVAGLSVAETAHALGRPEATVRSDTFRGLARLRLLVGELDAPPVHLEAVR